MTAHMTSRKMHIVEKACGLNSYYNTKASPLWKKRIAELKKEDLDDWDMYPAPSDAKPSEILPETHRISPYNRNTAIEYQMMDWDDPKNSFDVWRGMKLNETKENTTMANKQFNSLKSGIESLKKESTDVEGAAKYLPEQNPNAGKVKVTITPKHRAGQVGRPKGKPIVSYHDPKDLQKKTPLSDEEKAVVKKYKDYGDKVGKNAEKGKKLTEGIDEKDFEDTKKKMSEYAKAGKDI